MLIRAFAFTIRIVLSLYYLNPKFKPLAIFRGGTARFVRYLVGNTEDRFSHNEAHVILDISYGILYDCIYKISDKAAGVCNIRYRIYFSIKVGRTGAVVSVAYYGPRGPWFETWPRHSLLWP